MFIVHKLEILKINICTHMPLHTKGFKKINKLYNLYKTSKKTANVGSCTQNQARIYSVENSNSLQKCHLYLLRRTVDFKYKYK